MGEDGSHLSSVWLRNPTWMSSQDPAGRRQVSMRRPFGREPKVLQAILKDVIVKCKGRGALSEGRHRRLQHRRYDGGRSSLDGVRVRRKAPRPGHGPWLTTASIITNFTADGYCPHHVDRHVSQGGCGQGRVHSGRCQFSFRRPTGSAIVSGSGPKSRSIGKVSRVRQMT